MQANTILDFILSHCDKNVADATYRALALKWLNLVLKDIQSRQDGFHFRFLEETGTLALVAEQFAYPLATAFSTIDLDKTIAVYDKINDLPLIYKDYKIFRQLVAKETDDLGDPRIFSIYSNDLILWPVPDFDVVTGTTDGVTTANKLIQSTATFITDGVQVGMKVTNTSDNTTALVTSVDSETQLTLDTDVMETAENYSIAYCVHVDYVKLITAATDSATTLTVPDKYEKVVIDGMLEFAYMFDPEIGSSADAHQRYEDGILKLIRENQQIICENNTPVSHRQKRMNNIDARSSVLFPLDKENM